MREEVDIVSIMDMIPHRYPFLLVDRVLECSPFETIKAIKNVTINEPFFGGHFPGEPVMPGVLMIEALAQSGAILHNLSKTPKPGFKFMFYFASIDNVKFKKIVTPGDQLTLHTSLVSEKRNFWRLESKASVANDLACSAQLLCAVKEVECD